MYHFRNDYSVGAHPKVLEALCAISREHNPGYGADDHCARAAELIRTACAAPQADVQFLIGGTQANFIAICAFLRPWEGVICPSTGHINGHEAGAVEATGHKLIQIPAGSDGKLRPADIESALTQYEDPHMVRPALVYLSDATETGAVYTARELEALSQLCRHRDLLLFVDGARLGCALAARDNDLTLPRLAELADAFTIGGTKNGALMGEALVLVRPGLQKDFFRVKKQRGGVLAKGWLLGAQFEALFTGNLYFEIARQADEAAQRLQRGLAGLGLERYADSTTNQVFPILPDPLVPRLAEFCTYETWCRADADHTVVRFVTSFATTLDEVDGLLTALGRLLHT